MIGSPEVNKVLRRVLSPVLRAQGFDKVDARNAWAWHGQVIWVLVVRSVGHYFSDVTGWPPVSLTVSLGVFYDFIPGRRPPKSDSRGRLLPKEYECESVFRTTLSRTIDQQDRTISLSNPAERARRDIWWLDRDGTNVNEVIPDIASAVLAQGLPWFERLTDLRAAYQDIENERDSYVKFRAAKHFAEHLDLRDDFAKYSTLFTAKDNELRAKKSL